MCDHHKNLAIESIEGDDGLCYPVDGNAALAVDFDEVTYLPEEIVIEAPIAVVEEVRKQVIYLPQEKKPRTARQQARMEKGGRKEQPEPAMNIRAADEALTSKEAAEERLIQELREIASQGRKPGKKRGKGPRGRR